MRATTPLTADSGFCRPIPTPSTFKRVTSFLFICLAFLAMNAHAQISVGPTGAGPLPFDTAPAAADFTTGVLVGNGDTFSDTATMDAGVATIDASTIVRPLPTDTAATPGTFSGGMRYNSTLQAIVSRPTTDTTNAAGVLLAKFVNNSGQDRSAAILTYSFVARDNLAGGHLYGFNVYWSLTGAPGSWTPIPELTTDVNGDHLATITFTAGNWTQGSTLYVLWADDNSSAITDPSYSIDNLAVVFTVAQPEITQQPQSTNVVVNRTIRLSVTATGIGLTYAWFKDGAPIDAGANPTAAQATLIITNAQPIDAGDYRVTVANPGGGVISDIATVNVSDDTVPPKFLFASEDPASLRNFRLIVDETICNSLVPGCTTDAGLTFYWEIVNIQNPADVLILESLSFDAGGAGTNITFVTQSDRDPTKTYKIVAIDNGGGETEVADLFGNRVPIGQSVTSAPSRIFAQGATYTGTSDAEIHSGTQADMALGTATSITVDNEDGGFAQALLRFDNLFGTEFSQIPSGAQIVEATLILNQTDPGSAANFHRMLIPWDQAVVTWNSMTDGVSADNIEASTASDGISPENAGNGLVSINVTASVQAWSDGQANYGWAIRSTGTGGWDWTTSESGNPPQLSVVFLPRECLTAPVFTTHPAPVTVNEGSPFSLTAGLTGACQATYQWTKDGTDIGGATSSSYSVAAAIAGAGGSGGNYRLRVTNPNGTATSNPALVTVTPDTNRPVVLRVINTNATTLAVTFSKVMGASAGVAGNYTQNGVAVSAAVLSTDGRSVTLTTAARTFPTAYSLRISGVRDNRATPNLIFPDPTIVPITTVNVISAWGGAWQYNTNNQDATPTWNSVPTASLDATWLTCNELFGTETSAGVIAIFPTPIATVLPPNTNTPPDMVTFYFRKDITLPALPAGASYAINHLIDDGAVFYLDGVEIGRYNMAAAPAPIAYATKSTSAGEAVFSSLPFTASAGAHILAVEVHQGGTTTSSDMLFGAQVIGIPTASPSLTISRLGTNSVTVRWTADTKWELINSTTTLTGNYTPVALPAGNPLGFYSTPATGSNHFFRLLFIGP